MLGGGKEGWSVERCGDALFIWGLRLAQTMSLVE